MTCVCIHTKNSVLETFPEGVVGTSKLLTSLGSDITEGAMKETPQRMLSGLLELTWGLRENENEFLNSLGTQFEVGFNEMVLIKNIDFVSLCEHHMLPILGKASVAYIPSENRVLGLSKLARLVEFYAARPQTQERMTHQIAEGLERITPTLGVGVKIEAAHLCMSIRGAKSSNSTTVTSLLTGPFKSESATRTEFLTL